MAKPGVVGIIFYESQKVISIAHGLAGVVKNKFLQWEVEQYNEFFRVKIDANGLMLQKNLSYLPPNSVDIFTWLYLLDRNFILKKIYRASRVE